MYLTAGHSPWRVGDTKNEIIKFLISGHQNPRSVSGSCLTKKPVSGFNEHES
jgi:hypothetical protein